MPQLIPFSDEDILEMQQMRWAGASLREIADYFGTSATTVMSYVRGVKRQPKGQDLEYIPLDIVNNWRFVLPAAGLPVPRWFVTLMQIRLNEIQQSH